MMVDLLLSGCCARLWDILVGGFLMGCAVLATLYPESPAERGNIAVHMPAPEDDGVQVLWHKS